MVLITGATSGVGRATAQLFARAGAKVIVSGRDQTRGGEVAVETGGRFLQADLSAPDDVCRLAFDARDVAATAARIAAAPAQHTGQAYRLTGPALLTYGEIATELSRDLGHPVDYRRISPDRHP